MLKKNMNPEAQKITVPGMEFDKQIACEVLNGLFQSPKNIASKYFYDQRGSELFDAITELDEYYIPRIEEEIFCRYKVEICEEIGEARTIVEPGAGSCKKINWLLPELKPASYVPMDISAAHLRENVASLHLTNPDLTVSPLVCDHTNGLMFGKTLPDRAPVFFYPGSSIGNFEPEVAVNFMRKLRTKMVSGGGLLIGVDTKKDEGILNAAYNDSKGVTAAFNINVLNHLNTLLDGNLNSAAFEHVAFYDKKHGRIEMHLRCTRNHTASLAGMDVKFSAGELINTEYSYKYHALEFSSLAQRSGLRLKHLWQDERQYFSVMYFLPD